MPCMPAMLCELKKRKKLDATSVASPAASALRKLTSDVIPELPSSGGQSAGLVPRTGTTSPQMALSVSARAPEMTWLLLGVGRKTFIAGGGSFPSATSTAPRSTEEACIVQVPGGEPGLGQSVNTSGLVL